MERNMRMGEFFAGMGMIRSALEPLGVSTVYANDCDEVKVQLYEANWGKGTVDQRDVQKVQAGEVPDLDLATCSFPCTDLSQAGKRAGLDGSTSRLIFVFTALLESLGERAPKAVLIENVAALGQPPRRKDLERILEELKRIGYRAQCAVVDARWFVPQSRRRLFIKALRKPAEAMTAFPLELPRRETRLADCINQEVPWWPADVVEKVLGTMQEHQRRRLEEVREKKTVTVHGAFRRTRDGAGRWEVRADECAGALRTAQGGSGRQAVVQAGKGKVSMRWLTAEEYARLQGAEDMRIDGVSETQAKTALGDGVCVPAVRWLARQWLLPDLDPEMNIEVRKNG